MKAILLSLLAFSLFSANVFSQTLKELAKEKNKYIGTAVNNQYLEGQHSSNPPRYEETLLNEFNCVVAENAFKMGYLLPNKPADPFNFTINDFDEAGLERMNALFTLAEANNMRVRGHAFIWYNQAPDWLKRDAPNWTDQQVFDFAEHYIEVLGTYTKGKVDEWDVVNEAINDDDTPGYRTEDVWYAGVSSIQDFLDHCFNVAKQVDPNADMYYNDYNIETKYITKNAFMLTMIEGMVDRNVSIDGVGLQSHFISGEYTNSYSIKEIGVTIDKLDAMGLSAAITELDIRICGGTTEEALKEQGEEYQGITEMFLTKDNCQSLLVWGVSDKGSWVPYTFPECDNPLLFNEYMLKKPAYNGVAKALGAVITNPEPGELSPYSGSRISIPGTVEVEEYDLGGLGVAYADNTAGNEGENFREDDVDVGGTGDQGGGYVVAWAEKGEWLKYSVNVTKADKYDFTFRVASPNGDGDFDIKMNNEIIISNVTVGTTGDDWESYTDVTIKEVQLEQGEATLEISFNEGGFNFNYIKINPSILLGSGSASINVNELSIYPNPSKSGVFNISEKTNWQVYNVQGALIKEGENNKIELINEPEGMYLVKTDHKIKTVIKQ